MELALVTLALCFVVVRVSAAPAGTTADYVQHYPYALSSEVSSDGDESGVWPTSSCRVHRADPETFRNWTDSRK